MAVSVLTVCFVVVPEAEARRMAVVVGNGDYSGVAPLKNPVNDAKLLSEKLEELDFDVLALTDLNEADLWGRLDSFAEEAADADIVLFFFSGHAFQLNNVNYLVPVDAKLTSVESITTQTWDLNDILERLESLKTNMVVMLDACRNNPLPASMQTASGGGGGLARIESGADTKVVFATQPQMVAYEGTGEVSYFTQALLDHLGTEGQSLDDLIRNVRNQVRTETNKRQVPWSGGNLSHAFYFKRAVERRDTLSAADIENLLLNFPPEQRPTILAKLAETVNLDLDKVETRIASIEPTTGLSVLIEGDAVDVSEPEPQSAPRDVVVSAVEGPIYSVMASPIPTARPNTSLLSIGGTDVTVALLDPTPAPVAVSPNQSASQTVAAVSAAPTGTVDQPILAAMVNSAARRVDPVAPTRFSRTRSAVVVTRASVPNLTLPAETVRVPVTGAEFWMDDDQSRSALAKRQPELSETLLAPELTGKDLARAVQTELDRLGCYQDVVDGAWGRNSRFALTSYFLAKGILFDDLEPTVALWKQLELEPGVICTGTQTRAPQRLARSDVIKPKPVVTRAPRGTIAAPAREEIKKGNTFIGIRVR